MTTPERRGGALVEHLLALGSADALAGASARTWLALDDAARHRWWERPAWVGALADRREAGASGVLDRAMESCAPSGWTREAAVEEIASLGEWPPALALRAADWVPEVRDRARSACEPLLAGPGVVDLAPVAFALRHRRLGVWLAERVEAALRSSSPEVLAVALTASDRRVRRFAFDVALRRGSLDLAAMLRGALRDTDLPIRVRCAEAATRLASDVDELGVLLRCRAAAVRAEAVRAIGREENAVAALTDRSALVRSVARRLVADPAAHCRALLPRALPGLGESGSAADADLVRPWLVDPRARVRADAVTALRRLGTVDVAVFEGMLTDASGAVTRALVGALSGHTEVLDRGRLADLLVAEGRPNVRVAAYRLLSARGVWDRVLADLLLVARDPERRRHAVADLRVWLSVAGPTAYLSPNAAEVRQALRAAEPWLDPKLVRELAFVIG